MPQSPPAKVWNWRAEERTDLPQHLRGRFDATNECKPVEDKRKILITFSGGSVALVERASHKALFHVAGAKAHSPEILPHGWLAVAASHAPNANGDRLLLFDLDDPEKELFSDDLSRGHGMVWDKKRKVLWALSGDDLRAYALKDCDTPAPSFSCTAVAPLLDGGGHDLSLAPGSVSLAVTTNRHVWMSDRDKRVFTRRPILGDETGVKGVSIHLRTRRLAYVKAEGSNWRAGRLRFLNPGPILSLPKERLYKARWCVAPVVAGLGHLSVRRRRVVTSIA